MSLTALFEEGKTAFSFEILPPLKGNNISNVYSIVDKLIEFAPRCINITTHHSEFLYKEQPDGTIQKRNIRKRPGSVAIAAALQYKYGVMAIPHMICKGFTQEETEYALIDLDFLGVNNLLLLRGDAHKLESSQLEGNKNEFAIDLQIQVNEFNRGRMVDGSTFSAPTTQFSYGMACYPEVHEEAPNMDSDIRYMKMKQDLGAQYFVTQMFFDNQKYFDFVSKSRQAGVTVPIIPGLKPIGSIKHLSLLPKTFRSSIPEVLEIELRKCKDDQQAKEVGVEWGISQSKELIAQDVPCLHFYTLMATEGVRRIAKAVF